MGRPLTESQRNSILDRDGNFPQMRHYSEDLGWHKQKPCYVPGVCKLQVHHIETRRNGGMNAPENLITLAICDHIGKCTLDGTLLDPTTDFVVHPDMVATLVKYREGNKKAFAEMFGEREELVADGLLYHNSDHDSEMLETALQNTANAVAQGWRWKW